MKKTFAMILLALAPMVPQMSLAGSNGAGSTTPSVAGILKLNPVTEHSYIAAWLPMPDGMSLAGIRWFNNDEYSSFPEVLTLCGGEEGLTNVSSCTLLEDDVAGTSFGWSVLTFAAPIDCGVEGAYLVFHVPVDGAAVSDGAGGGAGIGYASGAGVKSWVTVDGTNWVGVDRSFGLAIEPMLVPSASGEAAKNGGAKGPVDKPSTGDMRFETTLQSISPNPFNPDTEIRFTLREPTQVSVSVFDISGRRVVNLIEGTLAQGMHSVRWDGRDEGGRGVASGVYFVHMMAGEEIFSRRMLLVK